MGQIWTRNRNIKRFESGLRLLIADQHVCGDLGAAASGTAVGVVHGSHRYYSGWLVVLLLGQHAAIDENMYNCKLKCM